MFPSFSYDGTMVQRGGGSTRILYVDSTAGFWRYLGTRQNGSVENVQKQLVFIWLPRYPGTMRNGSVGSCKSNCFIRCLGVKTVGSIWDVEGPENNAKRLRAICT